MHLGSRLDKTPQGTHIWVKTAGKRHPEKRYRCSCLGVNVHWEPVSMKMGEGFKDAWHLVLCPENLSLWPGRAFCLVSASQKGQIAPCIWWSVEQIGILRHEVTSSVLVVQLLGIQHKGAAPMTDFCCFSFNCLASAGNIHSASICLVLHIRVYDWGHFTFSWETGDTLFAKVFLLPVAMKIFAFTGYRNELSESAEDCIFHILLWDASCVHVYVCMLSCVQFFVTTWTAACQASLSFTIFQSLLKLMSIELVMPSNHLILCHPLLLLPSIFPSIKVFSNDALPFPSPGAFPTQGSNLHWQVDSLPLSHLGSPLVSIVKPQKSLLVWVIIEINRRSYSPRTKGKIGKILVFKKLF